MRWDWVRADNPELVWVQKLIALRKQHRALRVGDFRLVESEHLLAFERYTDRVLETLVVVANPSDAPVTERIMIANPGLMDDTPMVDLLAPAGALPVGTVGAAFMTLTVPAQTLLVLSPQERSLGGYSRYKRVR